MFLSAIAALVVVVITACASRAEHQADRPHQPVAASVFELTLDDIQGKPYPLQQHAGQVLLLVNVASKCGFSGQYAALQALYERYRARGLVVIGVPANDFLWQEPGDNAEIAQFCSTTYGVTFPMMAKAAVTGDEQSPLYRHLTSESSKPGAIRWNFTKFLIGRDGKVIDRFGPSTEPDAPPVLSALESALAAPSPSSPMPIQ